MKKGEKATLIVVLILIVLGVVAVSVQANIRVNRLENLIARLPNRVWEETAS